MGKAKRKKKEKKADEKERKFSLTPEERWAVAQVRERNHWESFIANMLADKTKENFWLKLWTLQAEFLFDVIINELGLEMTQKTRILEIGGGAIGLIRWFREGQLYALDPLGDLFRKAFSTLPLEEYDLRRDVKYIAAPIEEAKNLELEPFDIALMFDCLDHTRSPKEALASIHAILKPGGLLFESTTTYYYKVRLAEGFVKTHPWAGWSLEDLLKLVTSSGFTCLLAPGGWPHHRDFDSERSPSTQELHVWERME